ncbi:Peptidase S9 [Trypanosoma melophagium]|uniref:Peptidase S9 n=1 Tax=Trypanosoma melophagium TaxID=715481 RepID=UPI003519FBB4|nr:Peptidase S9 [Trypanosoma melophagium]
MSKLPLKTYVEALRSFDTTSTGPGKPQQLCIVHQQIYWLQGMSQELYTVSLEDSNAVPTRVIVQEKEKEKSQEDCPPTSKEEELLRERLRRRVTGISSYRVRPYDKAVFFTSGTNMFLYYPSTKQAPLKIFDYISEETRKRLFSAEGKPFLCIQHMEHVQDSLPSEKGEGGEHTRTNMLNVIAFVYDSNLYRATIKEQQEDPALPPLNVDVESITRFGDKSHECGTADYIMQEEFSRYTGHYSTDHYILFTYTDTSMLRVVSLLDGTDNSSIEEMPYCRVGDPNARSVIVVYELKRKCFRVVPQDAITAVAPWAEYIPQFGFKNKNTIYFSLLSRTQEQYCVLSCPIESLPVIEVNEIAHYFSDHNNNDDNANGNSNTYEGKEASHLNKKGTTSTTEKPQLFTVEWEQCIPWAWVEVKPGSPILFGNEYDITICHASETPTAHYHLFVRKSGGDKNAWRPLTQGEWNIKPESVRVLYDRVIFIANAGNRLGSVLFSVPLQISENAATVDRLTRLSPPNEHVYSFTVKNDILCYVAGTAAQPPELYQTVLNNTNTRRFIDTKWHDVDMAGKKEKITSSIKLDDLVIPTILTTVNRRGVPLSGRLFVSPNIVPGKPAPLAIYVYGGPHVQLVHENDYDGTCKAIFQLLAKMGISVLVADGQMSNANGLRDLSICKHNMGNFETTDYVDFARFLSTSKDLPGGFTVDPARVAVFGWSYGGYATLLAMSQAADVFKIGFAGAPVGDWRLYDTGYTERYMGELYTTEETAEGDASNVKENKRNKTPNKAYITSRIANFVSGFPDDLNRVFIAHGLLDENVHFFNTCDVINAMIEEGKPYHIILYPGERHGLMKKKASRLHHDAMVVKTLTEML